MGRRRRGGSGRKPRNTERKLLINARESEESRLAVIEGGRLEEYYIERSSLGSTLGNIYKARVINIEKSIGAAFLDFGHSRQGFLHVSDLCMAAVGEGARSLLASVQAAREHAHDDDMDGVSGEAGEQKSADQPDVEDPPEPLADARDAAVEETAVASDDESMDDENAADEDAADSLDAEAPGFSSEAEALEGGAGLSSDVELDPVDDEVGALARARAESVAFARGDDWEADAVDEDVDDAGEDERAASGNGEVLAAGAKDAEATGQAGSDAAARSGKAFGTAAEGALEAGGTAVVPAREEVPESPGRGRRSRGGRRRGGRRAGAGRGRNGQDGGQSRASREMPPIQDILQKGQEIVVQVIKDGIGTKGPTLTTYLSIPGRFLVLMPGINKRGVSRKVVDGAERNRLKEIVRELKVPEELGFIVRTAGVSASAEDLQRDLDYLLRVWKQMSVRVHEHSAPVLLYQENDLVIRTLRDLYDGSGEIIVDDATTADTARKFLSQIMPACVDMVQIYDGEQPLFTHYKVEDEIELLLENRVELPSGGSLIFEQTEALVAIDVNSGRFKAEAGKGIDDTAFQVNSEAATEIARQIRLRDLGGMVVVDFIDMRSEKHRKGLEQLFKEALRRDRARLKVARFSPFGIIELTRQRVRPSLKRSVHSRCPYCAGTGYIPSDETSCLTVVRRVRAHLTKPGAVLVVTVRPEVAEAVLNQQRDTLLSLEKESQKSIFVRSDHRLSYEDVEVRAMVALPDDLDHRRA